MGSNQHVSTTITPLVRVKVTPPVKDGEFMLDRSKKFGEVHGDPTHPYKFEQGDKYFNAQEFECTYEGKQIEFLVDERERRNIPEVPETVIRIADVQVKGSISEPQNAISEVLPPVVPPKRKPGRPRNKS